MPTEFKNVSEITENLIQIVQDNSDLKDVWIRGKISDVRHIRNCPLNFTLEDDSRKIECVIFETGTTQCENLPAVGKNVSIKGDITLGEL